MISARLPMRTTVRRLWPLIVVLGVILFPFGWLANLWPVFGVRLGWLFPDVNAHAVGHTTMFFLLGLTLLIIFPQLRKHPWRYIALLLVVGIGQESFQLAYKHRSLVFDDFRDLFTDLAGGLMALLIVMMCDVRASIQAAHNPGDTSDR